MRHKSVVHPSHCSLPLKSKNHSPSRNTPIPPLNGFKLPDKSHRCKSDLEDEEWEEELDPEELPEPFAPDFPEDE